MGGRYFITGVQLGMLMGFNSAKDFVRLGQLLEKIENDQYVGYVTDAGVSNE